MLITIGALLVSLTACKPSNITAESSGTLPEDVLVINGNPARKRQGTRPARESTASTYSIPADAPTGEEGGPGMMKTTEVVYSSYPDEKLYTGNDGEEGIRVCLYILQASNGINQTFELVDEVDAEQIVKSLTVNGLFRDSAKLGSFKNEQGAGELVLEQAEPAYIGAKEDVFVAAIANTFIDNFSLKSLKLKIGSKDYGELVFNNNYNIAG
jgi:hypothetical protein